MTCGRQTKQSSHGRQGHNQFFQATEVPQSKYWEQMWITIPQNHLLRESVCFENMTSCCLLSNQKSFVFYHQNGWIDIYPVFASFVWCFSWSNSSSQLFVVVKRQQFWEKHPKYPKMIKHDKNMVDFPPDLLPPVSFDSSPVSQWWTQIPRTARGSQPTQNPFGLQELHMDRGVLGGVGGFFDLKIHVDFDTPKRIQNTTHHVFPEFTADKTKKNTWNPCHIPKHVITCYHFLRLITPKIGTSHLEKHPTVFDWLSWQVQQSRGLAWLMADKWYGICEYNHLGDQLCRYGPP